MGMRVSLVELLSDPTDVSGAIAFSKLNKSLSAGVSKQEKPFRPKKPKRPRKKIKLTLSKSKKPKKPKRK